MPRDSLETALGDKLSTVIIDRAECSKYSWTLQHRQGYKMVVAFYRDGEDGQTRTHIEGSGTPELRLKPILPAADAA